MPGPLQIFIPSAVSVILVIFFFTYFFAGHNDWLWDGGVITQKQFLPVKSLHFGDTGTPLDGKEGR